MTWLHTGQGDESLGHAMLRRLKILRAAGCRRGLIPMSEMDMIYARAFFDGVEKGIEIGRYARGCRKRHVSPSRK